MEYTTLTDADRLVIARDDLRTAEADHYRLSLRPTEVNADKRLDELESEAKSIRVLVKELEETNEASMAATVRAIEDESV